MHVDVSCVFGHILKIVIFMRGQNTQKPTQNPFFPLMPKPNSPCKLQGLFRQFQKKKNKNSFEIMGFGIK